MTEYAMENYATAPVDAQIMGQMPQGISPLSPDASAIAAAEMAKARTLAQFSVAQRKPRSYDNSRVRILQACKRPNFAAKVEYHKPVGGGVINGPSIRLAELCLREWGNIDVQESVVFEDDWARRILIVVCDLETNTTLTSVVTIGKTIERRNGNGREIVGQRTNSNGQLVYIVKATEDEIATKQAAAVSKAIRNEGLRLIPQEIIEEALEIARATQAQGIKADPEAQRKRLADAFAGMGIMPASLEEYLKHPLAQTTPNEILTLQGIYNAIKSGEAKWADFVSDDEDAKAKAEASAQSKADALKEKIAAKKAATAQ